MRRYRIVFATTDPVLLAKAEKLRPFVERLAEEQEKRWQEDAEAVTASVNAVLAEMSRRSN